MNLKTTGITNKPIIASLTDIRILMHSIQDILAGTYVSQVEQVACIVLSIGHGACQMGEEVVAALLVGTAPAEKRGIRPKMRGTAAKATGDDLDSGPNLNRQSRIVSNEPLSFQL